jgi:hypothetical protein
MIILRVASFLTYVAPSYFNFYFNINFNFKNTSEGI